MKVARVLGVAAIVGLVVFFGWALWPHSNEPPPSMRVHEIEAVSSEPVIEDKKAIALISGGEPVDVPWTSRSPAALRVRRILPDPAWMTSEPTLKMGDLITLALFDDAVFEAEIRDVTQYPSGAVGVTAHLNGSDHGVVYLSYFNGELTASIEGSGQGDFAIRSRSGEHFALEVDWVKSDVLEGGDEMTPAESDESVAVNVSLLGAAEAVSAVESEVVDVMVVYTPAAAVWASANGGMESLIAQAMQRANAAHDNSDTQVSLRLVLSAEVNYVETASESTDLSRLRGTSDGHMDDVHALRNQVGADLVCLFQVRDDVGGYGYVLSSTAGSPGYGFCLARVQQVHFTYTVVHEWGHNMGCDHSKTQTSSGPGLYNYSAGWQWDDTAAASTDTGSSYYGIDGYCSVMTYENFDGAGDKEYRRIAYFSNPDISYTGDSTNATGDAADGDNARTIRNMRAVIANYRAESEDWDADGLPNDWEKIYFGGEIEANASAMASNGVNTLLQAYIAGLDPTDVDSVFDVALTNGFIVRWNAASGRVYSVWSTTELPKGFQTLEATVPWPRSSWTDEVECAGSFYRVGVELEE